MSDSWHVIGGSHPIPNAVVNRTPRSASRNAAPEPLHSIDKNSLNMPGLLRAYRSVMAVRLHTRTIEPDEGSQSEYHAAGRQRPQHIVAGIRRPCYIMCPKGGPHAFS